MNKTIETFDDLINQYHSSFAGLPNHRPIVRNGIKNDAFTLVVLHLMYSKALNLKVNAESISRISKIIIAPPDSGIDLFVEIDDGSEYYYHIIQTKYEVLAEAELKQIFASMERTIKDYLKNPQQVQKNLYDVISDTNFTKSTYNQGKNCRFIIVHKGDLNFTSNQKGNEQIVTLQDLYTLKLSLDNNIDTDEPKVPYDEFDADAFNNYSIYSPDKNISTNDNEWALLCNLRGYDLALLCNKYNSTSMGRNILFGQNLRESLENKSKTFKDMEKTISDEPERFWHYNNGITILTESLDIGNDQNNVEKIKLKNFSIINGAQTTSALGKYLMNATITDDQEAIEKLKRVYVLARIMEVNNSDLRDRISIYNNSQNPITTRDMVSTRIEQRKLQKTYIEGEKPNIYIGIRSGAILPTLPRFEKHQQTTNESLAQLAFAAFLSQPFSAKDKRKSLFNKDYLHNEYKINEYYDTIFNWAETDDEQMGILFKKTRSEIDEVLFIKLLYNEAKKHLKSEYTKNLERTNTQIEQETNSEKRNSLIDRTNLIQRNIDINSTCLFYCISFYYEIKKQFEDISVNTSYDYDAYYRNTIEKYKENIIKDFANFYLKETILIIGELVGKGGSVANWIRRTKSQNEFYDKINDKISLEPDRLEELHHSFIEKYKK